MEYIKRKSKGYVALMAVLVVGAASAAVAIALLSTATDSQRSTLVNQYTVLARQAASACAEIALQVVHDNTSFTGTAGGVIGSGSCSYTVTNTGGNNRTITTSGTYNTTVRRLQITITIGSTITINTWQETT
jgi:hypothetical protein